MKAIVKARPEAGFDLLDVELPTIGAEDVLIKVDAAAICGSDLPIFDWEADWVQHVVRPGQIIGHEFCGRVAETGSRVSDIQVGDAVTGESHLTCGRCARCLQGDGHVCSNAQLLGFDYPGAFADYVILPATNVVALPHFHFPIPVAAIQEPFSGAVHAATKVNLTGESILITGCGPAGLMAIAVAKHLRARQVIATDPSLTRQRLAALMGADYALAPNSPELHSVVRRETGGQGVDILLEMSGAGIALLEGFNLLRNAGSAVLFGLPSKPLQFDFADLIIAKGVTAYGIIGRRLGQSWNQAFNLQSDGLDLQPIVTHHLALEDFEQGFSLMKRGLCGKVILFPDRKTLSTFVA